MRSQQNSLKFAIHHKGQLKVPNDTFHTVYLASEWSDEMAHVAEYTSMKDTSALTVLGGNPSCNPGSLLETIEQSCSTSTVRDSRRGLQGLTNESGLTEMK